MLAAVVLTVCLLSARQGDPVRRHEKAAGLELDGGPSLERLIAGRDAAGLSAYLKGVDPGKRGALVCAYAGKVDLDDALTVLLARLEDAFGDAAKTSSMPYEIFLFSALPGLEGAGKTSLEAKWVAHWLWKEDTGAGLRPGKRDALARFFAALGMRSEKDVDAWQNGGAAVNPDFHRWYERRLRKYELEGYSGIGGTLHRLLAGRT
ncbi:MAG: hypothetical protein U0793_29620 [Gemmataceae bacterium]